MRRGHTGVGGWRSENPRHYRPRGGGTPHFRSSTPYGQLESPRFPPSLQRYRGPRPFNQHLLNTDESGQSDHGRGGKYSGQKYSRPQDRGHHLQDRSTALMNIRGHGNNRGGFNQTPYFGENSTYKINNMGDGDHRQQIMFGPRHISPWVNPPFKTPYINEHKSPLKTPKHHNMGDTVMQIAEYSGHRPPASDHYSATSGPNNNNNPYSHSVDDTVDIVRKRLLNRDSQEHSDAIDQREVDTNMRKNIDEGYQEVQQEQCVKKRVQRHRQHCHKMKNNIVHQLCQMDKDKIHKLMDNPNSSSKFEYAINSLITESQKSLNRHMRSEAEKSLITANSSSDFIHNHNNTIYEDTFMKQMQGVLDPQDTVLLEDIKPIILAELSKVITLDDFEKYEVINDQRMYPQDEQYNASYYNEPTSEDYPHNSFYEYDARGNIDNEAITGDLYEDRKYDITQQPTFEQTQVLFERRPPKKLDFSNERSQSQVTESWQPQITESWQPKKSVDTITTPNKSTEDNSEKPRPLFDNNCDQLSDDDDPFADLDNQYHVAVDHTFIEQEDGVMVSPVQNCSPICEPSPVHNQSLQSAPKSPDTNNKKIKIEVGERPITQSEDVLKEIDSKLQSIAKSPLKLFSNLNNKNESNIKLNALEVKQEIEEHVSTIKGTLLNENDCKNVHVENVKVKPEPPPTPTKEPENDTVKHTSDSGGKYAQHSNSRKRSVDQKPSHRKEKRKKSSHSECQQVAKSILNMLYVNKPSPSCKDSKNTDSLTDKGYSDKYVKRKEPHKAKVPEPKPDTEKNNSNHSHSMLSPNQTSSSSVDQTPSKSEKVKLTTIDMFSEIPKKGNAHQSHKNTSAQTSVPAAKSPEAVVIKPVIPTTTSFARKLTKRHMGTQVIRKLRNKECQTVLVKKHSSGTQTDPVQNEKNEQRSENPLERMKEIDMEIQMLLQEKFKLYNSMETNDKNKNSSSALGMAVLNVPLEAEEHDNTDPDDCSVDSFAEDFSNLPVMELEQIALESTPIKSPPFEKKDRRHKIMEKTRKKSESPTTRKRKAKTPNISLLEQIITDDRPLEEIISLDDFERTPSRSKKRPSRSTKKKSSKTKSVRSKSFVLDLKSYDLKPCSVLLECLNIDEYIKSKSCNTQQFVDSVMTEANQQIICEPVIPSSIEKVQTLDAAAAGVEGTPVKGEAIEDILNDIQIDMMDVSEDIVIGDEVRTGDKDVNGRLQVTEEIILDNSQSSADTAPEVSEGECKLYDYSTDDTLKRDSVMVTGNGDSVLAVECIDNAFLAACLDGNVYHFSNEGQLINTMRGSNLAVTCLTIVKEKYGTTVYTGSLDSRIRYYDLETGLEKGPECNVLSPIQTMDRAWDTVFVGTRTGFVLQFECKNNMLIPVSTVKFSEQSILALRAMREGPRKVLLVAARSDNVTIKDAQTGLLLRTLEGPKMTVYSLLYEDGKVYCGTSTHQIHVFDYASGSHVHAHEGGKGAVCLRATGGLVFAGCYDGAVYVYREGATRPLAQLRGPALMLLSLAVQGTKIIAGYKDRSLFIWKIPLAVLQEMIL